MVGGGYIYCISTHTDFIVKIYQNLIVVLFKSGSEDFPYTVCVQKVKIYTQNRIPFIEITIYHSMTDSGRSFSFPPFLLYVKNMDKSIIALGFGCWC
jgi:hypothetical protein